MLKIICLTAALGAALGSTAQAADLQFDGRHARAEAAAGGSFVLHAPKGAVQVAAAPMRSQTGSVMFDALFALAQQEMDQDRVDAIRDPAFDEGRPVPCECFQTGARWPYVWTRDVSFAADLALARLDPQRTRQSLQFKLSAARDGHTPGLFVAQDTGSGGSWPISSDRVVWFLAARHLLDDPAFADQVWQALQGTLAQDRAMVFDAQMGLYRGETSFLDWREQTYPDWTREDVRFIGDSYALSTNVLHYQALRLAERLAGQHGDARAADYKGWADALAKQIDARFWREDIGQYMSYIGEAAHPVPYAKVDLLGLSLGILADVLPTGRARRALAAYPVGPAGSPVVWPQEGQQPIYHNRAIWPFVSAYSLRAARQLDDVPRIAAAQAAGRAGAGIVRHTFPYHVGSQRQALCAGAPAERGRWPAGGRLSGHGHRRRVRRAGRWPRAAQAAGRAGAGIVRHTFPYHVGSQRQALCAGAPAERGRWPAGGRQSHHAWQHHDSAAGRRPGSNRFRCHGCGCQRACAGHAGCAAGPAQGHGLERSGGSRSGAVEGRQGSHCQQRRGAHQRRWPAALPQPDPPRRPAGIAAQPDGLCRAGAA